LSKRFLNGSEWAAMILVGAEHLARNVDRVNALNVFPVPDGDTGTNMNLTMSAGVAELKHKPSEDVSRAAEVLSKGLLMGARGNSGVILSQLFRGFSRALTGQQELTVPLFANALQQGVDTAYKAVVKPVEGTILTVAREAARHGLTVSRRVTDLKEWMRF
jgi:dihydroxyacetone kinase-like predicted kinase